MNRRHAMLSLLATTAAVSTASRAASQGTDATPNGSVQPLSLPERVASVDPQTLLEALRTAPVAPTLFPAESGQVVAEAWDDTSDRDLDGTLGGIFFLAGEAGIGVGIVHPDAASAAARIGELPAGDPVFQLLGMSIGVLVEEDYAVAAAQIDYLLLSGGMDNDLDAPLNATDLGLHALSRAVALLNHLGTVLTDLGA